MAETEHRQDTRSSLRTAIARRFSLHHDKADDAHIDATLRAGVELSGATPWVLMFAIVIASIGLNVNSTAVIIGAMLISPLMGPIIGIGYGVGILDFPLIRRSFLNLGIATAISLGTSTLYFLVTPLHEAQSELLARTTPTIWDVLIALAGGLAGIIGATRRERSNVLPGVAIATALMPPLCTAGYALANGNWTFFVGAFYLFSINCVFIAVGTVIVIELLRLPHRKFVDATVERRVKHLLFTVVLLTALPSVYLAYRLVNNEIFNNAARQFVREEFQQSQTHVTETRISPAQRLVELSLIGEPVSAARLRDINLRLAKAGLPATRLLVHQAGDNRVDVSSLKAGILNEIYRDSQAALKERDQRIAALQQSVKQRGLWLGQAGDVARELQAQFASCKDVVVGEGIAVDAAAATENVPTALLSARFDTPLSALERQHIESWFKVRVKASNVRLLIDAPAARAARKRRTSERH